MRVDDGLQTGRGEDFDNESNGQSPDRGYQGKSDQKMNQ
jgi:hypothetical protein